MQGAKPLASPGLNPGGTGAGGEPRARRGAAIPVACQPCSSGIRRGGLPSLSPARPAFSSISFPHPPDPLPPRGRGRILVFLCKGLRPLHPGGLNPGGTGAGGEPRARRGGRRFRSPADLDIRFISFPHPPDPLPPWGRGRLLVHFAGGSAPGTPAAGAYGSAQRGKESVAYRLARAGRVQPRGCKGRSPLHEITLVSPSPRGMGANTLRFSPGAPPPAPRKRESTVRCKRGGIGCLQVSRCRPGSAPGMQGAQPLA